MLRIGDVRVHHVEEWQGNFLPPSAFFVGYDEATFRSFAPGLTPQYYRDDADSIYAFLQSWILEVDGLKVLYDTGAGNAKERPGIPIFGGLDTPFLTRMAAAGFAPDDIDVVICSHLHIDHVGWNTQLHAGRWVPTFPNARYLFSAIERDYWDPQGPGRPPDRSRRVRQHQRLRGQRAAAARRGQRRTGGRGVSRQRVDHAAARAGPHAGPPDHGRALRR